MTRIFLFSVLGGCLLLISARKEDVTLTTAAAGISTLQTGAEAPTTAPSAAASTDSTTQFVKTRGTEGFWRLGQDATGVWWFIRPTGEPEFLNTVTTVQPLLRGRQKGTADFISQDWREGAKDEISLDQWATTTLGRVEQAGFKGLGAWCHHAFHKLDVPMTRDLNVSTWIVGASRLFDAAWKPAAETAIRNQVTLLRDNRSLVGYYIDNELDWTDSNIGPSQFFDGLELQDPNRQQVLDVIRATWPAIDSFNKDWNTQFVDWSGLSAWRRLPTTPAAAYERLSKAWTYHFAKSYFELTTSLIRKHDPNHLILGVRFRGSAVREVVHASKEFTDAQSLNYYPDDAQLDGNLFRTIRELSGQPIIITEYSFHALDGRSGNRNTFGFSGQVMDQQARADGYRLFTKRLAQIPFVIGADWFQWMDEPPSGRASDGEDVNFGVVDVDDQPYELLAAAVRETTPLLNGVHATSASKPQPDVWRQGRYSVATAMVPFLDKPVRIDGSLRDWPSEAKLAGIRHGPTLGLERSQLPLPNVYLGWSYDGLYLGFEVFDRDIQTNPVSAAWWARDCVEFWVSTSAAGPERKQYDDSCHSFFFVPTEFPEADGQSGVVGQWHRPGDALKTNLIPHPDVQAAARILPDRYVVEMFIPAKALNGFEPRQQPDLSFNFYARNFQHAAEYFWSAPKNVGTQLRPDSWGHIRLQPPSPPHPLIAASEVGEIDPK